MHAETLDYYRMPTAITQLRTHTEFLEWLTNDVRAIFQVVQGLIIHDLWVERYGTFLNDAQACPQNIAYMEDILDKALELDPHSLAIPRAPEKRVIGCCREFATLLCALLRAKRIPARSRCGFATYLVPPGYFEDHWICEYWNEQAGRWIKVDPQIDPYQQSFIGADFDPLNIPDTHFIVAGKAWDMCRREGSEPNKFGIACDPNMFGLDTLYGLWFVRGNLLRDFAALNKVETVPFLARIAQHLTWNSWRLVVSSDEALSQEDMDILDSIAAYSMAPDQSKAALREYFQTHPDVQPPQEILERGENHRL